MAAAYQSPSFPSALSAPGPIANAAPVPTGTFLPGTKVQVGDHRVIIERYLSEGGFAHVYVVRLPRPVDGKESAVLKRVAVPDKETLATLRTEVETMKKLKGRRHIVTFMDSHASQLKNGGYEVFLLMEYCNGGGLIDFMNTRLQNRLTEPEVLKIFSDVSQGVACMHYLKPPLLHRDLKVENVLIGKSSYTSIYKLCDFGSAAPPRPAATNAAEGRLIEDDIQKHTTLQYRSPEMIDVYRKQPIDEKSDIWALGVLLYKLCYYKTPFEDQGQMAILNASFKFPSYPSFSDRTKRLTAMMLQEHPQRRPNIYEVVREVASIRGTDVPIKDIYAGRTQSETRRNEQLPVAASPVPTPTIGAVHAAPSKEKESIPEITPMRRGRPTRANADTHAAKPSPSPLRPTGADPFTALDGKSSTVNDSSFDDVSSRFPALDDFSILHEKGNRFSFDQKSDGSKNPGSDMGQRVANALADEAFAQAKTKPSPAPTASSIRPPSHGGPSSTQSLSTPLPGTLHNLRPASHERRQVEKPSMVSTGTGASPPPSPSLKPQASKRPIWRVPDASVTRSSSQPRKSENDQNKLSSARSEAVLRPGLSDHRSKSQTELVESPHGQRDSTVTQASPYAGPTDESVHRSKSASSKSRPSSLHGSKPSILRRLSRDKSQLEHSPDGSARTSIQQMDDSDLGEEAVRIDSNVEYLKAMEGEESAKRKEKRLSSGSRHLKRSSLPSVSLSGTKNKLAGRFGEAFRKFEHNNDPARHDDQLLMQDPHNLTPIAGSEATDGRSDDGRIDETEDLSPEVRRELERRRLSDEERRVAEGAAAYKQRLAGGGPAKEGPSKAASIQTKVRSLLDESGRGSPSPTKTARGYGKFTDETPLPNPHSQLSGALPLRSSSVQQPQPITTHSSTVLNTSRPTLRPDKPPHFVPPPLANTKSAPPVTDATSVQEGPALQARRPAKFIGPPKPQPKPQSLRTGERPPQFPMKPPSLTARQPRSQSETVAGPQSLDGPSEPDWENNFSKRYPDLSGLEIIETSIEQQSGAIGRPNPLGREMIRDV